MPFSILTKLLASIAALLFLALGFILVVFNTELIAVDFVFVRINELSSGIAMLLAFSAGALCGLLLGMGLWGQLKQRATIKALRKDNALKQQELNTLRTQSLSSNEPK